MTVNSSLLVGQDPNQRKSFIAAEALEAHRLVILKSSDPTQVEYPAAEFDVCIGITLHAAESGKSVDVALGGYALLEVDGNVANIALHDSIVSHTADGLGRKVAGGAAGNRACIGRALAASTADGDLIPVLITHHAEYFAS